MNESKKIYRDKLSNAIRQRRKSEMNQIVVSRYNGNEHDRYPIDSQLN